MPPQRTCISCRGTFDKRLLERVVRTLDGEAAPDPSGKASGRGAYICSNPDCREKAIRSKRLEKALKCQVSAEAMALIKDRVGTSKEDAAASGAT